MSAPITTDLQLGAVLGGLSLRARRRIDMPMLVDGWRAFVHDIATGHAAPHEYGHALGVRDLLAEVMSSVRPDTAARIADLVRPDDEAFFAATRVIDHPRRSIRRDRWWWASPRRLRPLHRDNAIRLRIFTGGSATSMIPLVRPRRAGFPEKKAG